MKVKIRCPQCNKRIWRIHIDIATNMVFCRKCKEFFKIQGTMHVDFEDSSHIYKPGKSIPNPPEGAWFIDN